jgi:polyisoprenoid-binding protein YceI
MVRGGIIVKNRIAIVFGILLFGMPFLASGAIWQVDPDHSSFEFKVRHLMVSNVKGDFGKMMTGIIDFDDQNISSLKAEVTLDAASINTRHAKRDEHLRGADFFDVTRYPTITFVSRQVTKNGPDRLRVTGDLTMRGVTREIFLDVQGPAPEVKDPSGKVRRGFSATGKINRKDFGITWNRVLDTGGVAVGDEVEILVELEVVRK